MNEFGTWPGSTTVDGTGHERDTTGTCFDEITEKSTVKFAVGVPTIEGEGQNVLIFIYALPSSSSHLSIQPKMMNRGENVHCFNAKLSSPQYPSASPWIRITDSLRVLKPRAREDLRGAYASISR